MPCGLTGWPGEGLRSKDGVAESARQRKVRTCPELVGPHCRAHLIVLALVVGGHWSHETQAFITHSCCSILHSPFGPSHPWGPLCTNPLFSGLPSHLRRGHFGVEGGILAQAIFSSFLFKPFVAHAQMEVPVLVLLHICKTARRAPQRMVFSANSRWLASGDQRTETKIRAVASTVTIACSCPECGDAASPREMEERRSSCSARRTEFRHSARACSDCVGTVVRTGRSWALVGLCFEPLPPLPQKMSV